MRTRRGSLLWGTTSGDAILMYKAGDVVKPVVVSDQFFTGVVRSVDTKTNKITVAWGGGPESQHDPDEIMPMPFFRASPNGDAVKVASSRRMRADVDDLLDAPEIGEESVESDAGSIEQTDFVADDMEALLNRQVGAEFYSAYLYYMVAAICQSKGLVGFQAWFERQGDGEIEHAMKVYKYLVDTGSALDLPSIPGPGLDSGMEVAELTRFVLDHEMGVTQDWKRIGQLAKQQDNPATCKMVMEFMDEQIEEEDAALTLHQKVQLADSGSGILLVDNDLKGRSPIAASDKTATNPPMDQYCGEPSTHGLDTPRGGGFSVMKDLAYDLHDEANDFADVNPRIAAIQAGLKEIAWDAGDRDCAECDASMLVQQATSGMEPPDQQPAWYLQDGEPVVSAEKTAVSAKASMGNGTPTEAQQRTINRLERAGFRQVSDFVVAGEFTVVMQKRRGPTTFSGEVEEDGSVNGQKVEDFLKGTPDRMAGIVERVADWLGQKPVSCDFCHKPIKTGWFVDGSTMQGPWGIMCPTCFPNYGTGIGPGKGQKYDARTGRKLQGADLDGLKSRRAMYWCAPDRTYRLTQQEQQNGTAMCPQCKCDMSKERFTRSEKLLICPECGFKVPSSKAVTKVEVKVPAGVEVDVTTQGENGEEVQGDVIMATRRGRFSYADPAELADLPRMQLDQIASLIYKDWKAVNYAAKPYLEAMSSMKNVSDMYGADSGTSIVAYFLANASSWRGDVAKVVKKELQRRIRR